MDGTQNVADLMTKQLDNNTLRNFTHESGTELRNDKSEAALGIESIMEHMDYIRARVASDYRERGQLCVCTRRDREYLTYKSSAKGGPYFDEAKCRVTVDNTTGSVLDFEKIDKYCGQ